MTRPTRGGTPAANNSGIASAHGKYITILCADDMRSANSLEKLWQSQKDNPHSFSYDDVELFGSENKLWEMPDYDCDRLLVKNYIHCGIMFPAIAVQDTGGYPEAMRFGREDWAMNVSLSLHGYCGHHVKNYGYRYRRGTQNRTLTNTTPTWRAFFAKQIQDLYPEMYAEERPMGCCGSRTVSVTPAPARSITQTLVGADGMTLVEYTGGNYGNQRLYGAATGTMYTFSASKRQRFVDNRDLSIGDGREILERYENAKLVFRSIQLPKEVKEATPPPEPVQEAENIPEPVTIEPETTVKKTTSRKKKSA